MPRRTLLLLLLSLTLACAPQPMHQDDERCDNHPLHAELSASENGTLRIVVTLVQQGSEEVATLQDRLLEELQGTRHEVLRRYDHFPIMALMVGEDAFCRLVVSPLVESVQKDEAEPPAIR
jgi:hypothetical protein